MGKKANKNKQQKAGDNTSKIQQIDIQMPNLITPKQLFKTLKGKIHPEIDELVKNLVDIVNSKIKQWEQNQKFEFQLPQSQFDHNRQTPVITYLDQDAVVDDVVPTPLSQSQKQSLYQSGRFVVNSRKYSIPYKWLVHPLLYKGKIHREQQYLKILGVSFSQFYQTKSKLFGDQKQCSLSLVKKNLKDLFWQFVDTFIGIPFVAKSYNIPPEEVLQIQRCLDIKKNYWDIIRKDLNYLYFESGEFKSEDQKLKQQLSRTQINRIETQFNLRWRQIQSTVKQKLGQQYQNSELDQKIEQQKFKMLMEVESELDPEILQQLHLLLYQQRDITLAFRKLQKDNLTAKEQIEKQAASHQIKSRCPKWFSRFVSQKYTKAEQDNYYKTLETLESNSRLPFFKDYVIYCKKYEQLKRNIAPKISILTPQRTYSQSYNLSIPQIQIQNNSYYLKFYQIFSFNTGHYGWRYDAAKLIFISIFNMTIHFSLTTICSGPYSLSYLFRKEPYYSTKIINQMTGEIGYSNSNPTKPLRGQITQRISEIRRERIEFQESPDTGFMKKSYGRVFNLVYCYIFLGVIKLGLFQCFLKPFFCIFAITFSLVFLLSCWYIGICAALFQYFFSILFYKIRTRDFVQEFRPFPIFQIILRFLIYILYGLFLIICALILNPVLGVLILLWSQIYKYSTTIYYEIIFWVIKIIARSPTSDSKIAWRVEGPGISKNFSQKLNPDDIYILFLSECQKIELNIYQQSIINKLNSIIFENNQVVNPFVSSFQVSVPNFKSVQQSINFYSNKLNQQVVRRMRIYPVLHNSVVRFTQEQLNQYTGNCIQMVQFFMKSHKFCDFYSFFSIDKNSLQKKQRLVVAIWERIFGTKNVFEAYNSSVQRYQVVEDDRDCSQTQLLVNQIKSQNQFRKQGHRKFKYYETPKSMAPFSNTFMPISSLVNSLKQINYSMNQSKVNPEQSVIICPNINKLAEKISHLS